MVYLNVFLCFVMFIYLVLVKFLCVNLNLKLVKNVEECVFLFM